MQCSASSQASARKMQGVPGGATLFTRFDLANGLSIVTQPVQLFFCWICSTDGYGSTTACPTSAIAKSGALPSELPAATLRNLGTVACARGCGCGCGCSCSLPASGDGSAGVGDRLCLASNFASGSLMPRLCGSKPVKLIMSSSGSCQAQSSSMLWGGCNASDPMETPSKATSNTTRCDSTVRAMGAATRWMGVRCPWTGRRIEQAQP
mmetsp:Transcript_72366/g.234155  ORF Transcript_72366/g.234155 Transcript_72366/m.234155 type:complete len:208 (+) Transcript_72366:268-891(+)